MDDFCLYNNVHIPSVGFGTWHIKDRDTIEASIILAINLGYKHIDTASKYKNEEFIGDTLKKYNKSIAQICIKWCLQNNVLPLPKSTHYNRIQENIDINNFNICDEDMKTINAMPYFASSGLDPNRKF